MKTMSVTEVSRNFSAVLDGVESDQEEIILMRNRKPIARLVPEPPEMTAMEVLGDLYRTLDDGTADALAGAIKSARRGARGTLKQLRDPWAS
jgi:antitoxin (DNA-binding transcriptional repressor) of toxin-antitoxin stability system